MASYACPVCNYVYDEKTGAPREGYPRGTLWEDLPDEFMCPECAVRWKEDFVAVEVRE